MSTDLIKTAAAKITVGAAAVFLFWYSVAMTLTALYFMTKGC